MDDLKERRKRAKLTQAQLAKMIGVPEGTYVNWELGRSVPSKPIRKALNEALAKCEGKGEDVKVSMQVPPEVYEKLAKAAAERGQTPNERLEEVIKALFGIVMVCVA